MDKLHLENSTVVLNVITKLVEDIERKVSEGNVTAKECNELRLLKEKCCAINGTVSVTAFHGISSLVERRVFTRWQAISMLVSLLPSINQYGPLVSTVGDILKLDLQSQISEKGSYQCPYSAELQHPFIMILKHNKEKSWCEIYNFIIQLLEANEIKCEHKIKFLRPVFRHLFWSSCWRGSQFQLQLFNALLLHLDQKEYILFVLEVLMWQEMDIHYCLLLQEFCINMLKRRPPDSQLIVSALTPMLAQVIKWLIITGHNPTFWISLLISFIEIDKAPSTCVLYILTDVIMETPSKYINLVTDICKKIIYSTSCSKYVVYKFVAVILNWFITPSPLAFPLYKTVEEILGFVNAREDRWTDHTAELIDNKYYRAFGGTNKDVKFAVDLMLTLGQENCVGNWLKNVYESNEEEMQLKLHSLIYGIVLCETDKSVVTLCLDLLFRLIDRHKEISFSTLCLLFYKLGREVDPVMQKLYLFSLPKLAVKKENISLIVGIIESLKKGCPKVMAPLVVQLYLSLWRFDNRTYSHLHKMLHDATSPDWEMNVSKAIALREICRRAPHLHAKDLVSVLSNILNENSVHASGLPAAIAIEAVTELCKAYVIDPSGTWNAIQPKLKVDNRPKVVISLCKFFAEIPNLNSSEHEKHEKLVKDVIPMLWKFTFEKDSEVVKTAFRALSKFNLENFGLSLLPEVYRVDVKIPKDFENGSRSPDDILTLPFIPAECWIQFLQKVRQDVLQDGGELLTVLLERELNSLPRGTFYLPPEKSEPLSYSYLPERSVCRALVGRLQKESRESFAPVPLYVKEMIRVLSHEYSKLLPPLNWSFLETFMSWDSSCLHLCLALIAKQGSSSASAKSVLENHLRTLQWESSQLEQALFLYRLLPLLCKTVSYNILQNFLEKTIDLCLQTTLNFGSLHFENILENLTQALRNKSIQSGHKNLIVKQLERVLIKIPSQNQVMRSYALCATEFPVKSIEHITSVKDLKEMDGDWLRRSVAIRCAIAMRSDIKNPLVWLNEFTEAAAHCPNEQSFILETIWLVIRSRRTCHHSTWLQELLWRIQASINASTINESSRKVTLFLIEVFLSATIVLSGYDCLFIHVEEFTSSRGKKLEIFPQSLCVLLDTPDWMDLFPKVEGWLQKLSKWIHLPRDFGKAINQALLTLRGVKSFADENALTCLFNSFSLYE